MTNKPMALDRGEMTEIAEIELIRQMWGAETVEEMEAMLDTQIYAVKFDYHSGGPGYIGDYFILQGDAIGEVVELVRDSHVKIKIID